jgi:hypothetical protein
MMPKASKNSAGKRSSGTTRFSGSGLGRREPFSVALV